LPDAGPKQLPPIKTAQPTPDAGASAKGPQGEEACKKSRDAAQSDQIEAAVNLYRACQNGGQTAPLAHRTIQQNAGPSAQRARFRHDCRRAKSIADAASSINAAGSSQSEAAQCKP
jgi:hypothetical protein